MNLLSNLSYHVALIFSLGMFNIISPITAQDSMLLAAPPNLVIELFPSTIELGAGEIGQVQIVVRNPSDQVASDLAISWVNNTSLLISSKNKTISELTQNAEMVWTLEVRQKEQALDAGKIYLQLDYNWIDGTLHESKPVPRLMFIELQITIPTAESVANVAGVEVKSTLTSLNEQRPGSVYLILENKSDVPLHVTAINLRTPNFIKVESSESINDLILLSHEKRTIPYQVQVDDVVPPNKYVLLFEVNLAWERGGQAQVGTLIASHEVDVGVFGESQILTLLGIPAFFLLPGFLMIIAVRLLWTRGKTTEETAKFPLATASSEFWFVAISLSLLIAVLYPLATKPILGVRRNYLEAYGLLDVLNLWFGSIILAVLSYLTYFGTKAILLQYRQKQVVEKTPSAKDTPLDTLHKLTRQNLTMYRERALINIKGKEHWTFLLQEKTEKQETYWVAPRIHITNKDKIADLQNQIYELLEKGTDIEAFLKLSTRLTLTWDKDWAEPGPYRIGKADVIDFNTPDVMVEFD